MKKMLAGVCEEDAMDHRIERTMVIGCGYYR